MSLQRLAQLLYLLLPVFAANMAAPFARCWPAAARPISERWLGSHKTWLGYGLAVAAATLVAGAQSRIGWRGDLVAYGDWPLLGVACGLAAMLGDSAKSFVKRRLGIAPGARWLPADQIDFALAGLMALKFWVDLTWRDGLAVLCVTFVGALGVNRIAHAIGLKSTPW